MLFNKHGKSFNLPKSWFRVLTILTQNLFGGNVSLIIHLQQIAFQPVCRQAGSSAFVLVVSFLKIPLRQRLSLLIPTLSE